MAHNQIQYTLIQSQMLLLSYIGDVSEILKKTNHINTKYKIMIFFFLQQYSRTIFCTNKKVRHVMNSIIYTLYTVSLY